MASELPRQSEQFVRQLTESQNRIYGYVYSLLGDHSRSADVVQEVNLVLWRKIGEFDSSRPFLPWAFAIARMQVLAHLRDSKRDRLLLDAELAESLSSQIETASAQFDSMHTALRSCLHELTPKNRELVELRYFRHRSISQVAESSGRSAGAVKVALLRIRQSLADCVRTRAAAEGTR